MQAASSAREKRDRETTRLFELAAATTDPQERLRIQQQIVCLYLDVASAAARRFRNRGVSDDDLQQIAWTALVVAVQRFDPSLGQHFLAFAIPTIHGSVKRHFRDHGWVIRPPRRLQELQLRIGPAQEELTQRLGRSPRPAEMSAHLQVPLDDLLEALVAHGCFTPMSLDHSLSGTPDAAGETVGGIIASLERPEELVEARVMLNPLLQRLSDRDRTIVAMRFFEQRTQQEIGDHLGVSQIQVSRLLSRILRDLHRMLTTGPAPSVPRPRAGRRDVVPHRSPVGHQAARRGRSALIG